MYDNGGWNALYLENHDQARTVSRWGSDKPELRQAAAKMFATFLGLQSGTLFLYQGQELGMSNIPSDWGMEEFRDLETLNHWKELCDIGDEDAKALAKTQYHIKSRDNARTPMQWSTDRHAGFTSGEPWFRVNDSYSTCNAATQVGSAESPFEHWAEILRLRKNLVDIFVYGNFEMVDAANDDVFAYRRTHNGDSVLVVCNFREKETQWLLPSGVQSPRDEDLLISTHGGVVPTSSVHTLSLRPFEALAYAPSRPSSRL